MAKSFKYGIDCVDCMMNNVGTMLDGGYLYIYSGSKPSSPNYTDEDSLKLVQFSFSSPAFQQSISGTAMANSLSTGIANETGVASWFRCKSLDLSKSVFDGTVGIDSDFDLTLERVEIATGDEISISSFKISISGSSL